MINKINKKFLFLLLILISLVLVSAFVIEYHLGYKPCSLCIYERIPYFISIFLILKILFNKNYQKITLFILFLVFLISATLGFYHFGIEQGFFNESLICAAENLSENISKEELLTLLESNPISCKDIAFKILGFSLASINTIFSIILSVIFIKLFINYEKN
jgi:disulfide bond formation protein DsbB